jgi:hypothetical protein
MNFWGSAKGSTRSWGVQDWEESTEAWEGFAGDSDKKEKKKTGENQKNKRTTGTKKLMTREPKLEEPILLATIPPVVAPHLPKVGLEGIGEGFL